VAGYRGPKASVDVEYNYFIDLKKGVRVGWLPNWGPVTSKKGALYGTSPGSNPFLIGSPFLIWNLGKLTGPWRPFGINPGETPWGRNSNQEEPKGAFGLAFPAGGKRSRSKKETLAASSPLAALPGQKIIFLILSPWPRRASVNFSTPWFVNQEYRKPPVAALVYH